LALSYNGWKGGISSLKSFINNRHNNLVTHSLLDIDRPDMLAHGLSNSAPTSTEQVLVWAQVENAIDPIEEVHLTTAPTAPTSSWRCWMTDSAATVPLAMAFTP